MLGKVGWGRGKEALYVCTLSQKMLMHGVVKCVIHPIRFRERVHLIEYNYAYQYTPSTCRHDLLHVYIRMLALSPGSFPYCM